MKKKRIGFDAMGVIEHLHISETADADPTWFEPGAILGLKAIVEKYGADNCYIISRARPQFTSERINKLKSFNFFEDTGFLGRNIYFVYDDYKSKFITQLDLNFYVDDSIGEIISVPKNIQTILYLCEQNKEAIKKYERYMSEVEEMKEFSDSVSEPSFEVIHNWHDLTNFLLSD